MRLGALYADLRVGRCELCGWKFRGGLSAEDRSVMLEHLRTVHGRVLVTIEERKVQGEPISIQFDGPYYPDDMGRKTRG